MNQGFMMFYIVLGKSVGVTLENRGHHISAK